jgi:hypothetical protein
LREDQGEGRKRSTYFQVHLGMTFSGRCLLQTEDTPAEGKRLTTKIAGMETVLSSWEGTTHAPFWTHAHPVCQGPGAAWGVQDLSPSNEPGRKRTVERDQISGHTQPETKAGIEKT